MKAANCLLSLIFGLKKGHLHGDSQYNNNLQFHLTLLNPPSPENNIYCAKMAT